MAASLRHVSLPLRVLGLVAYINDDVAVTFVICDNILSNPGHVGNQLLICVPQMFLDSKIANVIYTIHPTQIDDRYSDNTAVPKMLCSTIK